MQKVRDDDLFGKYYVNLVHIYLVFNLFSRSIAVATGLLIQILPYVAIKLRDF